MEVRENESTELLNETYHDTSAGQDHSQGTKLLSSQATPSNAWKQHESLKQSISTEVEQIPVDESRHRRHSQESLLQSERNTGIGWHSSTDQLIEMEDQASNSSKHPPQSTNDPQPASQWPRKKTRQGWRYGVLCAAAATCTVLVINVLFAIVTTAVLRGKPERWESGSAILLEGSNKQVHAWSIALHLIINGFSSIILSGSNYTMQCLAAPSRAEVDRAHDQGKPLDIGIQSIYNVFGRISWKRCAAWWLLAISSVPVHLFYNSAIFYTFNDNATYSTSYALAQNDLCANAIGSLGVVVASQNFLDGKPFSAELAAWSHSFWYTNQIPFNGTNLYPSLRDSSQKILLKLIWCRSCSLATVSELILDSWYLNSAMSFFWSGAAVITVFSHLTSVSTKTRKNGCVTVILRITTGFRAQIASSF